MTSNAKPPSLENEKRGWTLRFRTKSVSNAQQPKCKTSIEHVDFKRPVNSNLPFATLGTWVAEDIKDDDPFHHLPLQQREGDTFGSTNARRYAAHTTKSIPVGSNSKRIPRMSTGPGHKERAPIPVEFSDASKSQNDGAKRLSKALEPSDTAIDFSKPGPENANLHLLATLAAENEPDVTSRKEPRKSQRVLASSSRTNLRVATDPSAQSEPSTERHLRSVKSVDHLPSSQIRHVRNRQVSRGDHPVYDPENDENVPPTPTLNQSFVKSKIAPPQSREIEIPAAVATLVGSEVTFSLDAGAWLLTPAAMTKINDALKSALQADVAQIPGCLKKIGSNRALRATVSRDRTDEVPVETRTRKISKTSFAFLTTRA